MQPSRLALTLVLSAALAAPLSARAAPPRVVADIPPVHSLVARVMQGVGDPALILSPGASPHLHALRPSEAAALADADVVFWIGDALTPWIGRALATLAPDATSVALLDAAGTVRLGYRDGAAFRLDEPAGTDGGADHEREHGEDGDAHGPGGFDPHAWLDPVNAAAWLGTIAETLSDADPANAPVYARNAAEGRAEIEALAGDVAAALAPVRGRPFIVFHDAYHYLEHRFGMAAAGAIALGDASAPSPARLAEIRDIVRETGARCVFAEPQFAADLVDTVTEGTAARAATLDPLGMQIEPGPGLYDRMMRDLTAGLRDCLAGER